MALSVDVPAPDWMTDEGLREFPRPLSSGVDLRCAPDPADGRGKQVSLTEAGLALRQAAIAALAPDLESLVGGFGERHFSRAIPFLAAVRDYLDRARDP